MPTWSDRAEPVPGPKANSAPQPAGAVGRRPRAGRQASRRETAFVGSLGRSSPSTLKTSEDFCTTRQSTNIYYP